MFQTAWRLRRSSSSSMLRERENSPLSILLYVYTFWWSSSSHTYTNTHRPSVLSLCVCVCVRERFLIPKEANKHLHFFFTLNTRNSYFSLKASSSDSLRKVSPPLPSLHSIPFLQFLQKQQNNNNIWHLKKNKREEKTATYFFFPSQTPLVRLFISPRKKKKSLEWKNNNKERNSPAHQHSSQSIVD